MKFYMGLMILAATACVLPLYANSGGGDNDSPFGVPQYLPVELTIVEDKATGEAFGYITSFGDPVTHVMPGDVAEKTFWRLVGGAGDVPADPTGGAQSVVAAPGGKHHKAFNKTAHLTPASASSEPLEIQWYSGGKLIKRVYVRHKKESEDKFLKRVRDAQTKTEKLFPVDPGNPPTTG